MSTNPFQEYQEQFFKMWNDNMEKMMDSDAYKAMKKNIPGAEAYMKVMESMVPNVEKYWRDMTSAVPSAFGGMDYWKKMTENIPGMDMWKSFAEKVPGMDFWKNMTDNMPDMGGYWKASGT